MLDTALKEWSIICDLLLTGRQTILLRKGGIHESAGPGRFELEFDRFLLFPSWLHQTPQGVKEEFRGQVTHFGHEPPEITFQGLGEVGGIWPVPSRAAFGQLDDLHGWSSAQVDMRFSYKPQNPLYLVAVRTYRLVQPHTISNSSAYGGCRSWVPLIPGDAVDDAGAGPVLDDAVFAAVVRRISDAMTGPG